MLTMATNPLNTKQRYLPILIIVLCSDIVPVISKTRCHQERRAQQVLAGFWKKVNEREESFSCFGRDHCRSVDLSTVDKKMNFQYWAFMLFYTEPNLIQSRACSTLKALNKFGISMISVRSTVKDVSF